MPPTRPNTNPTAQSAVAAGRQAVLRTITREGVASSAMVGIGETYFAAFALALGHSDATAGLLASVPLLAGAVLQMATPKGLVRLQSYRRWVVGSAVVQALTFVPLIWGALAGRLPTSTLFISAALYWAAAMSTAAGWNPWVGRMVPRRTRARYFAHRARYAQAAVLVGICLGGVVLHVFDDGPQKLHGFALLFAIAFVARAVSSRLLALHPDADPCSEPDPDETAAITPAAVGGRRLFAYLLGSQLTVQVAAPYFTPYMLEHLHFGYAPYVALTAASFLARIVAAPMLGRFAHNYGARRMLRVCALGITPLPLLWLVSNSFGYLLVVQLIAGVAWGGYELATLLLFFDAVSERSRPALLAKFNLANAVAMVVGAMLGAWLLGAAGSSLTTYAWLFGVSALGRAAVLPLLGRIPDYVPPPGAADELPIRTMAVRPSMGAIQRPVLAGLPGDKSG